MPLSIFSCPSLNYASVDDQTKCQIKQTKNSIGNPSFFFTLSLVLLLFTHFDLDIQFCFQLLTLIIKAMYLPCCYWDIVAYFLSTLPLYCNIACCYLQTVVMVTQWRSATKEDNSHIVVILYSLFSDIKEFLFSFGIF